jgi:hypothetical protein
MTSSFFMAGPDFVHWQLTAVEHAGPFRLSMHHAQGVIVEYFKDSTAALLREHELETLLVAARTGGRAVRPGVAS